MLKELQDDVFLIVLQFCSAEMLLSLLQTCKTLQKEQNNSTGIENVFASLCYCRWRANARRKKVLGLDSMRKVYQVLASRRTIPKGKFTERFSYVLGNGRSNGVDCWVLISHTQNTRLRVVQHNNAFPNLHPHIYNNGNNSNSLRHMITIRLCVQNVTKGSVQIDLSDTSSVRAVPLSSASQGGDYQAEDNCSLFCTRSIQLVAYNGTGCTLQQYYNENQNKHTSSAPTADPCANLHGFNKGSSEVLTLSQLEFAVLQCEILTPSSVVHETDFLAMLQTIAVQFRSPDSSYGCEGHRFVVKNTIIDEMHLWDYYVELPGGVILLRDKPSNSWM